MYFWERDTDRADYVHKAMELASRIRQASANTKSKKYTFLGLQKLCEDATEIGNILGRANRLRVDIPREAQTRTMLHREAQGLLDTVSKTFGSLHFNIHFPDATLAEISELFWETDKLIASIIQSDEKRKR